MASGDKCRECGTAIPADSPAGFCPQCLLGLGLESGHEPEEHSSNWVEPAAEAVDHGSETGAAAPRTEKAGDRIGRYRLLEEIGHGGCGVVYMAEQEEPVRRKVALKVIKLGMDTRQVVARFEAERQALALMDYPNIAKVLDAGATDTGRPYFVMELVGGIKITDYCDSLNLTTRQRLDLFIQVCCAIQHAHQKGIIHRDIKPSNVLVTTQDGTAVPKVIDFGIAKATQGRLTDHTLFTAFEQFIGTPAYMSPEQAQIGGLDIDTRSDIYSLGVLLYELLTGKTPFDAKELLDAGLEAMRRTICEKEAPKPSTRLTQELALGVPPSGGRASKLPGGSGTSGVEPAEAGTGNQPSAGATSRGGARTPHATKELIHLLRGDLDWIVMKCLEKERARRYETANGLARDIERHLNNEPVVASPPSSLYRFQKLVRRNKIAFGAGTAVAVALIVGIVIATAGWQQAMNQRNSALAARADEAIQRQQAQDAQQKADAAKALAERNSEHARRNLYAADMKAVQQYLAEGNLGAAQTLLSSHVPKEDQEDLRSWEWRHFWMLAQGDQIHRFDGHRHTVSKVQFSPDGNRLISLGVQSGELILWDCRQRRHLGTLIQPTNIVDFAVTADGGRIAILFESGQLEFWDAELGSPREFCPVANVRRFRLSPTDPRVYLNDGDSKVVMWNRATGDRRVLFAGTAAVLEDISDDGLIMAIAMGKSWVTWSVPKETPLWTSAQYGDRLDRDTPSARLLPRGAGLLTLAHGRTPLVYDAQVGRWAEAWPNDSGINERNQVAMAGDVNMLATASYMHNVSLWDLHTFQLKDRLFGHRDEAWCVAISPDHRFLASGGQDKAVMLWNNTLKPRTKELPGQFLSDPVFSPDGQLLALGRKGGQLSIFDLATATEIATLGVDEKPIQFSQDRSRLFALRGDFIRSYDSITWTLVGQQPLDFHMDRLDSIGIGVGSPDVEGLFRVAGSVLAARDAEGVVRVAGLSNGITRVKLTIERSADVIAISPDEMLMATASRFLKEQPGDIQLWHLADGRLLGKLSGHNRAVKDLRFSADGRHLVSCSLEPAVRVWNVASGQSLQVLKGHRRATLAAAFTTDGRTLATVNDDRTLKLWSLSTSREVASFNLPQGADRVGFSPDGRFLVAYGGRSQVCSIWYAPTWEEIAAADAKAKGESKLP